MNWMSPKYGGVAEIVELRQDEEIVGVVRLARERVGGVAHPQDQLVAQGRLLESAPPLNESPGRILRPRDRDRVAVREVDGQPGCRRAVLIVNVLRR